MKNGTRLICTHRIGLLLMMLSAVGLSAAAYADGLVSGQVAIVQTVGSGSGAPGNYDFRVFPVGNPVICNGQNWAFVNVTDANYQAIVANILAARAMGAAVSLNWTQTSNGYCQIDSIAF